MGDPTSLICIRETSGRYLLQNDHNYLQQVLLQGGPRNHASLS